MKITGEHVFVSSRERVWAALEDPQMLANALPGVRRLDVTGPDEYAITVSVGVGSVKGTYDGSFRITDKDAPQACAVRAHATGGPGSVEAVAQMQMRDGENGGALLTYDADANVTGPLAGVGQRLIGSAAKRTTREFLEGLDNQIQSPEPASHSGEGGHLRAGSHRGPRHRPRGHRPQRPGRLPAGADRGRGGALERPPLTPDGAAHFPRQDRRGG